MNSNVDMYLDQTRTVLRESDITTCSDTDESNLRSALSMLRRKLFPGGDKAIRRKVGDSRVLEPFPVETFEKNFKERLFKRLERIE